MRTSLVAAAISGFVFATAVQAAVGNDDFDTATEIASLPFRDAIDTTIATAAPDDPGGCYVNNSVWYRFTPTKDVTVDVNTAGSSYDPIVGVYTGARGSLKLVDCSRRLVLELRAGVTYSVMVTGCCYFGGTDGGDLKLSIQEALSPPNDDWDTSTTVTGVPFELTQSTLLATTAPDDDFFYSQKSVWFSFTPSAGRRVAISTIGSDYQTDVVVYTGTRDSRAYVMCDYPTSGVQWCNVEAGTTYHVVVAAAHGFGGTLVFSVLDLPTVTLTIDERAFIGLPSNPTAVRVSGTAICSEPMTVWFEAWFIQGTASSAASGQITCSSTRAAWTVDLPDYGYFTEGAGTATMSGGGGGVAGPAYASIVANVLLTRYVRSAAEQVADLTALVDSYNLRQLGAALHDKLVKVQQFLAANKPKRACERLDSFLAQVKEQRGKRLPVEQADRLTTDARHIRAVIGC